MTQLPDTILPTHYALAFEPDLKNFTFRGKETLTLAIKKPTKKITLHTKDLNIINPVIIAKNTTQPARITYNGKNETVTLSFAKPIKNTATLSLEFEGILNDNLSGFYRSKYKDKNGKEKYLATTQFEAPYARQAFPCIDEPAKKATFDITLTVDKQFQAISNMPIKKTITNGGKKTVFFDTTPVMSTYLLYMGVGDFEFLNGTYNNVKIRIVTLPGKKQEGKFALDCTKKFLKYFENYSKVKYPLPKLDLIGIPDFAAGAMENWGAITFREVLLLFDEKKTSTRVKKRIAEVIAHELWHQWSGNLVTMHWWNDLWLNESFATYMAYKALDHYFPKWNMWEDFVNAETTRAFTDDALHSTHPIAVKVKSPNEIEEIFDAISYSKGGSVLRMIESYIGENTFRKGVSNYLKQYAYKNATADDLWQHLAKVASQPIKKVMRSWINQGGYPILNTTMQGDTLKITQQRFATTNKKTRQTWDIPLVIHTNTGKVKKLMTKKSETISLKNVKWFKLNEDQKGFYRVNYPQGNLRVLQSHIKQKKLSTFDRWSIQNDCFHATLIGKTPLTTYFDLLRAYEQEDSYFVLSDIYANLYEIYRIFSQKPFWPEIEAAFKSHLQKPFENNLKRLSWIPKKTDTDDEALLRPLCITYLGFTQNPEVLKKAMQLFQKNAIHPDLKGAIFTILAQNGTLKTHTHLKKRYINTHDQEEKVKLLASLYRFPQKEILKKSLDFALSKHVRTQNLRTIFAFTQANPTTHQIMLPWTKTNWPKLKDYTKTHFVFMGFLEALITSHTSGQKQKELKTFLKAKNIKYEKTKANAFEVMQINTNWQQKNAKLLENYFRNEEN